MIAQIGVPIAISFIIMSGAYRSDDAKTLGYLSGVMAGIAGLVNVYAFIAVAILIIYMYAVVKVKSLKVLWSFFFGVVTPAWLLLPVLLYYNQHILADWITI